MTLSALPASMIGTHWFANLADGSRCYVVFAESRDGKTLRLLEVATLEVADVALVEFASNKTRRQLDTKPRVLVARIQEKVDQAERFGYRKPLVAARKAIDAVKTVGRVVAPKLPKSKAPKTQPAAKRKGMAITTKVAPEWKAIGSTFRAIIADVVLEVTLDGDLYRGTVDGHKAAEGRSLGAVKAVTTQMLVKQIAAGVVAFG